LYHEKGFLAREETDILQLRIMNYKLQIVGADTHIDPRDSGVDALLWRFIMGKKSLIFNKAISPIFAKGV
jgi:hypothetical protein